MIKNLSKIPFTLERKVKSIILFKDHFFSTIEIEFIVINVIHVYLILFIHVCIKKQ